MKTLIVLLILITSLNLLNSQEFQSVDIKKIEAEISNENSPFFYPSLYVRYSDNDTTLNFEEYRYLYYGHVLQPYFNPNLSSGNDSVMALRKYLTGEDVDLKRIMQLAEFSLRLDPFYLGGIYILGVSYDKSGDSVNANKWGDKYLKIIKTIWNSGDGKSSESAFKVLSVSDEYAFLEALGLRYKEKTLITIGGKTYDIITVEENKLGFEKVYFDLELFYDKDLRINNKK
ncbi:MAG: DUF4919 domain-containing protein [Candidatus Kapabacteria bacterium]|nr:DUF4919 domain-containing protein [Candidatus Kapabacteria bacterium]